MDLESLFRRNPLTKQIKLIRALQAKQQELRRERMVLKERALAVQKALDTAHAEFQDMKGDVERDLGVKISPVGIESKASVGNLGGVE